MKLSTIDCITRRSHGLLRALGNERRVAILFHLAAGELSVGELQRRLPINQSPLSQHLARLRRAGLVATRREAQTIHYTLANTEIATVLDLLVRLYGDARPTGSDFPLRRELSRGYCR